MFNVVVLSLMFAPQVTAIPNYLIMSKLGWVDSHAAIIVPAWASSLGLYLMKQFMDQVPDSLLDAARIDGASEFRVFWQSFAYSEACMAYADHTLLSIAVGVRQEGGSFTRNSLRLCHMP